MLDYLRRRRQEKAELREEAEALTKLMHKVFSDAARTAVSRAQGKIREIVRADPNAPSQPVESPSDVVVSEEKAQSEDERVAEGIRQILMNLYADAARRTMSRVDRKVRKIVREAAKAPSQLYVPSQPIAAPPSDEGKKAESEEITLDAPTFRVLMKLRAEVLRTDRPKEPSRLQRFFNYIGL